MFHKVVHCLLECLHILLGTQYVAFNFESDYSLDVTALEAGQTDAYQGDFLEGLHIRDAYRFEDWAFFERERLRGCYQEALAQQLGECEERGDDPGAVDIAHQPLRLDNLREDWYRALMRAYARLGKREAALAQYQQCREVLQAELGVEPVAETTALASAIEEGRVQPEALKVRAAVTKLRPVPKSALRLRFPTSLVGRAAEMETLRQVWERAVAGSGQTVLVEGEPGIGKTRLIEELLAEPVDGAVVLRAKCPELENPLAYTLF